MEHVMKAKEAANDKRVGLTHWVCVDNLAPNPTKYLYAEIAGDSVKLVNNTSKYAGCRYVTHDKQLRLIPMYDDTTAEATLKHYDALYSDES